MPCATTMNVLVLGANGMLGPHVVHALEPHHRLRLSDVQDGMDTGHEYCQVDVANRDAVLTAAEGMDAIVNLSVLRYDRRVAFDVNAIGCHNMMLAAIEHGIRRVVNSGPRLSIVGPTYLDFDHHIGPDVPPHPGTDVYGITKALGQEITRVYAETHDVYVLTLLVSQFHRRDDRSQWGRDVRASSVAWEDAADAFRCALEVDVATLPTYHETFFVFADLPHDLTVNEKTKRLLGWRPKHRLEEFWRRGN